MNFRTYENLTDCIVQNISKLPNDIDLVVGIPRSGLMVASILALYLNLPFMSLYEYIEHRPIKTGTTRKSAYWIKTPDQAKRVLIVDDSISSGKAVKEAKELIKKSEISCVEFTYFAVYALLASSKKVDLYFEICEQPRMFEWNYLHHWALEYCCMDIDGVICEDPSFLQNDDGRRYLEFLRKATPRFLPTQKVGKLVTTRLGKYRKETEDWLKRHHVVYDELVMMENVTAKARMLTGSHGRFKAEVYKNCDAILQTEDKVRGIMPRAFVYIIG